MSEGKVIDGNELLEICTRTMMLYERGEGIQSPNDALKFGECMAHAEAVRDTMDFFNKKLPRNYQTCFPEKGINNGQAVRIVLKYLNEHPADLHLNQTVLSIAALHNAYPCK